MTRAIQILVINPDLDTINAPKIGDAFRNVAGMALVGGDNSFGVRFEIAEADKENIQALAEAKGYVVQGEYTEGERGPLVIGPAFD